MIKERNIAVCMVLTIVTCGIYGLYWCVCLTNEVNSEADEPGPSGGIVVLLSIITCSIYYFYWAYKQGKRLDSVKRKRGMPTNNRGMLYIFLIILNGNLVVYALMQDELNKISKN